MVRTATGTDAEDRDRREHRSTHTSVARGRWIARFTAATLVLWSLLGIGHTSIVMLRRPGGWLLEREAGAARAVGLPLEGAYHVTEVMSLIDGYVGPEGAIWIRSSDELDDATWQYIMMQLAYLAYPRPVEVMADPSVRRSTEELGYGFTLRPHDLGPGWTELASTARMTLFRRSR